MKLPVLLQLQETGDVSSTAEVAADMVEGAQTVETISVMQLIIDGGWPMIPLAALFIWALFIFFERTFFINKMKAVDSGFMNQIKEKVGSGDLNSAKELCTNSDTPVAKMVHKGITRLGKPLKDIEASIENTGKLEVFKMEKSLSMMATIAGAAPMIGFLGTVLGMIATFHEMHQSGGDIQIDQMAGGIMQALVTTVAGLIVGIIAYVGYNTLVAKVDKVVHNMEATTLEFLDLLHEPA